LAELPDFPTDPVLARKLQRVGSPAGVAIALGDAAGCIEWVNAAFQRLTGYAAAEMTGKRLDLLRGLDIGASALDYVMSRFRRGEPSHLEIRTRATGARDARRLAIEVRPLGPDQGFVALVRDVTARKLAERETKHAPGRAQAERRDATQPRPTPVPRLTLRPVDVSRLVMESCDLLEAAVSGRTLLDLDLDGNLPRVLADVVRLREVLVNLVRHAADALAGASGTIRVQTSLHQESSPPGGVELEVRDTGWGSERARLAAAPGAGSSPHGARRVLSLAEIRGIVESHGGALAIASGAQEGTRALVVLPCAPRT
jgi:PAS domain S-box-containing protein